jgi:glycosyltransferase involved in cell wall biosynthesis
LACLRRKYEKFYGPDEPEPKIFIYTPTYNRGSILKERALETVLAQTYKNFIYLVVGDCCTDNTEEIVKSINDPRVQFFNLKKRGYRYPPIPENHWFAGPVIAANVALNMVPSKCSWIARLDDDDIWAEDHLESSLKFALTGNYEFVTSGSRTVRHGVETDVMGDYLYGPYFQEPLPTEERYVYNPLIGATNTLLYRSYLKDFKYDINCWRRKHNKINDLHLFHRLGIAGVRMGFLEKINFFCIPRPGEETIGLDAYRAKAEEFTEHFSF